MKRFLILITLGILSFSAYSQTFDNNLKHSWGMSLNLNYDYAQEYANEDVFDENNNSQGYPARYYPNSFGFDISGNYQYNIKRWLGLGTGLGFRAVFSETPRRGFITFNSIYEDPYVRNKYFVTLPVTMQLRPFKWFAFEAGVNNHIYLTHNDDFPEFENNIYPEEFQFLFCELDLGLRFWLSDGFSLGLNAGGSITPVAKAESLDADLYLGRYSLDLRYMWPLK